MHEGLGDAIEGHGSDVGAVDRQNSGGLRLGPARPVGRPQDSEAVAWAERQRDQCEEDREPEHGGQEVRLDLPPGPPPGRRGHGERGEDSLLEGLEARPNDHRTQVVDQAVDALVVGRSKGCHGKLLSLPQHVLLDGLQSEGPVGGGKLGVRALGAPQRDVLPPGHPLCLAPTDKVSPVPERGGGGVDDRSKAKGDEGGNTQ
mmetsp:Transcript_7432/g.25575  ORF Transcript_7432/g.25575 Transcript_7432/m.25575 type:complete len:202 (+) Transcript_7432:1156-1761(+)